MDGMLKELRLPRIREIYDQRIDKAAEEDWGYRKFLCLLQLIIAEK